MEQDGDGTLGRVLADQVASVNCGTGRLVRRRGRGRGIRSTAARTTRATSAPSGPARHAASGCACATEDDVLPGVRGDDAEMPPVRWHAGRADGELAARYRVTVATDDAELVDVRRATAWTRCFARCRPPGGGGTVQGCSGIPGATLAKGGSRIQKGIESLGAAAGGLSAGGERARAAALRRAPLPPHPPVHRRGLSDRTDGHGRGGARRRVTDPCRCQLGEPDRAACRRHHHRERQPGDH